MTKKSRPLHILLGVSGGIAAYKVPSLIRLLTRDNIEVKVVLTDAATDLVGVAALRTLTGFPVYTDKNSFEYDMNHIGLADWADLFLIVPATANTIAKIAHGIADNLLTTLTLSFSGPLLVAPAMNTRMWNNPATQDNLALIKKRGVRVLPVGVGELACGDSGAGRMVSLETIRGYVKTFKLSTLLTGKRVLISSGPTEEAIDPVRVITNMSSGKMGSALASAALSMGADVTVVSGPASAPLPEGVTVKSVRSSEEMKEALEEKFQKADIVIMAAAVSDYKPVSSSSEKMRRTEDGLTLKLAANSDILASLSQKKKSQFVVGFSLESNGGSERALEKMKKKGCDLMVYNQVDSALGLDSSKITILSDEGEVESEFQDKYENASMILNAIAKATGLENVE